MIGAIIVLFNPDHALLERLIASLHDQVSKIYIIDNTPFISIENYNEILASKKILYKGLANNYGIAKAQNEGINLAIADNCDYILLLDQDSSLAHDMVNKLLISEKKLCENGTNIAVLGPLFIDEKNNTPAPAIRHSFLHIKRGEIHTETSHPVQADYIISSGSLIKTETLKKIGLMKEELFIDWVDIEWCLRAKKMGFSCFIVPMAKMKHNIGDESRKILWKNINLHSDFRNYFIVRNAVYLLRDPNMGWPWRSLTLFKIPQYILFYSLLSNRRLYSLKLLTLAALDGLAELDIFSWKRRFP